MTTPTLLLCCAQLIPIPAAAPDSSLPSALLGEWRTAGMILSSPGFPSLDTWDAASGAGQGGIWLSFAAPNRVRLLVVGADGRDVEGGEGVVRLLGPGRIELVWPGRGDEGRQVLTYRIAGDWLETIEPDRSYPVDLDGDGVTEEVRLTMRLERMLPGALGAGRRGAGDGAQRGPPAPERRG